MRISDWSSDVCSSDLKVHLGVGQIADDRRRIVRLPVGGVGDRIAERREWLDAVETGHDHGDQGHCAGAANRVVVNVGGAGRSEEHTSELQSLMRISYAVFCLKNKNQSICTIRI